MKPFQLPAWRKNFISHKQRKEADVVYSTSTHMERVMHRAIDYIVTHAGNGQFAEPDLSEMTLVGEMYLRRVLSTGWSLAKEEARLQGMLTGHRMARLPKGRVPPLKDLVDLFRDKSEWKRIQKRNNLLTERLRRAYLQKLRRKFKEIVPKMLSGEKTAEELKEGLRQAWGASKSRVETIFRTETTNYFAETQVSYFESEAGILGFLFDSIRDAVRTDICRSRHGLIYRPGTDLLRKNTPSLHWRCRSHLIALANTAANRKMLEDPKRDPEKVAVAPLPPNFKK